MTTKIAQELAQVEQSADTLGWTKISQEIAQVEAKATTLGWTKISQIIVQVEYEPAKVLAEGARFDEDIEAVSNLPTVEMADSFTAFNYSNLQRAIDNPHVSPIRVVKIELTGKTLYLCDRIWGSN